MIALSFLVVLALAVIVVFVWLLRWAWRTEMTGKDVWRQFERLLEGGDR